MSAFPKAQQRPLSPVPCQADPEMRPEEFIRWLAMGQIDARGTIQEVSDKLRCAYIRPYLFPQERLYFSFLDWPESFVGQVRKHRMVHKGRSVVFDVPSQEWNQRDNMQAWNVRLT